MLTAWAVADDAIVVRRGVYSSLNYALPCDTMYFLNIASGGRVNLSSTRLRVCNNTCWRNEDKHYYERKVGRI
jgi:hypothetical protein